MGKNKEDVKELQLKLLQIQQGIWNKKARVILMFEGFDAAGKGGAIRKITEKLDPRGCYVHQIGPPDPEEQGKHWLYRFWKRLPALGKISIFDRSWYGRVLVERVDELVPEKTWKRAYDEINHFEKTLQDDGIIVLKFFLEVSKDEQLKRFQARLNDPYKQWKISMADIEARAKWDDYVRAVKEILKKTDTKNCPWFVIPSDHKEEARKKVLKIITSKLEGYEKWVDQEASKSGMEKLKLLRKKLKS